MSKKDKLIKFFGQEDNRLDELEPDKEETAIEWERRLTTAIMAIFLSDEKDNSVDKFDMQILCRTIKRKDYSRCESLYYCLDYLSKR